MGVKLLLKRHNRFIFSEIEEQSIEKWLLDMDTRGAALTLPMLRDMANLLLHAQKQPPLLLVEIGHLTLSNDIQICPHDYLENTTIRGLFQRTLALSNHGLIWSKIPLKSGVSLRMIFSTLMSLVLLWELVPHKGLLPQLNTMEKELSCKLEIASE